MPWWREPLQVHRVQPALQHTLVRPVLEKIGGLEVHALAHIARQVDKSLAVRAVLSGTSPARVSSYLCAQNDSHLD